MGHAPCGDCRSRRWRNPILVGIAGRCSPTAVAVAVISPSAAAISPTSPGLRMGSILGSTPHDDGASGRLDEGFGLSRLVPRENELLTTFVQLGDRYQIKGTPHLHLKPAEGELVRGVAKVAHPIEGFFHAYEIVEVLPLPLRLVLLLDQLADSHGQHLIVIVELVREESEELEQELPDRALVLVAPPLQYTQVVREFRVMAVRGGQFGVLHLM